MKLTPPATSSWLIAVILGVLGILLHENVVHIRLGIEAFWLAPRSPPRPAWASR